MSRRVWNEQIKPTQKCDDTVMHNVCKEISSSKLLASGRNFNLFSAACFTLILLTSIKESCSVLFCLQPGFLSTGVAGMMNWTAAIAPDVLKSRLQTGTT